MAPVVVAVAAVLEPRSPVALAGLRRRASIMPKPISSRKLVANRRNALHATGPRSPEGKEKVSRNALRHGILANKFLVTGGDGREDQDAYGDLHRRLRDELQPVGVLEERTVHQLGNEFWRLDERVTRAEQGAI